MAKGVQIPITGDASSAVRAFKQTHDAATGLSGKFGGLTGTVGKLAAAFGGLMIVSKTVDFFQEAAQAAMEDAKAKAVLHTAIENITGATQAELTALDAYITKTQAATGFTEEQLRPAMVKLTEATRDVGEAQNILAIAMDVATARGVSLETVTLALEKAQNGNVSGLQRLGVATKDAAGETLGFDAILQQLAATYGGATAAAADTLAGKMERMKLVFGEVKEELGAALLPVLEQFASFIMANMPTITALFEAFGKIAGAVLQFLADVVFPLAQAAFDGFASLVSSKMPGTTGLFETLGQVTDVLKEIFRVAWGIMGDVVGYFIDYFNSPSGAALIDSLISIVRSAMEILKSLWTAAWPLMQAALDIVVPIIKAACWAIEQALKAVSAILRILTGDWDAASAAAENYARRSNVGKGNIGTNRGTTQVTGNRHNFGGPKQMGGFIPGSGPIPIVAHGGEYVLTKGDTSLMKQLVASIGTRGGGNTFVIHASGQAQGEAAADAFLRRVAAAGVQL